MTPKQMETRLLEMQAQFARATDERKPEIRTAYRNLHRRWVAAKTQLTLGGTDAAA